MLGWLPTPRPDELFYSICARYQERASYPGSTSVNEELFGSWHIAPIIDLPCHLDFFSSALPHGHRLSVDRLIDEHTLLPFYSPFLPADRVKRIRILMRGNGGGVIHKLAGIVNSVVRRPLSFRFCPLCVIKDRSEYGYTYWHRLHQLPGIDVCPDHRVFLENSHARALNQTSKYDYPLADNSVKECLPTHINPLNSEHAIQLRLATDAKWLLLNGNTLSGLPELRNRYIVLLSEKGLAFLTGIILVRKLLTALKDFFQLNLLKHIQCDFDVTNATSSWPAEMVKDLQKGRCNHPLRHLLMMQFSGHTAESFFSLSPVIQPFGKGPWPCLNSTCSLYEKPSIKDCEIIYKQNRKRGRTSPMAIFKCNSCGFIYNRIGPDSEQVDLYRINRVLAYGPVWENALRKYWNNPKLDLREVAKRLGVTDRKIIKREAERLDLKFPRLGPGYKMAEKNKRRPSYGCQKKPSEAKINEARRAWLRGLKQNPKLSRSAFRDKFSRLYYLLNRYDKEWLSKHLRLSKKIGPSGSTRNVNWRIRDLELEVKVKVAAKLQREQYGKPVKITKNSIAKAIDDRSNLSNNLDRLPRTRKVLNKEVETRLQFAERRLTWSAKCFHEEGITPARSGLLLRATIGADIWETTEVKKIVDTLLGSFNKPFAR